MTPEQMKYDPALHHRRSIRLKGHDYAGGGLYFVTLCAHREFVQWAGGNPFGASLSGLVAEEWRRGGEIRKGVFFGEFVVMPDHVHGLIRIDPGASKLGNVVGAFKAAVSRRIRAAFGEEGVSREGATCVSPVRRGGKHPAAFPLMGRDVRIWHRNYYEMIVRTPEAEQKIAEYIRMNPWRCVQQFGNGLRGIGNPSLWNGEKLGVLCSRNAPRIGRIADADVYFGGWHSPKEQEILAWLLEKKRRGIACPAWGIDEARPTASVLEALESNRMLILEMRNRDGDLVAAEQRNRFVIENADALFVPHTTPGGMLERILKEYGKKAV
jgi:REP element-mobilizing transposase RayT